MPGVLVGASSCGCWKWEAGGSGILVPGAPVEASSCGCWKQEAVGSGISVPGAPVEASCCGCWKREAGGSGISVPEARPEAPRPEAPRPLPVGVCVVTSPGSDLVLTERDAMRFICFVLFSKIGCCDG